MPKPDFEFFEISDLAETLVAPSESCDPYRGMLAPQEGVFVQAIVDDVLTGTGVAIEPYQVEGPKRNGPFQYLEKAAEGVGLPIHREHAEFQLPLSLLDPKEDGSVYELYEAVAAIRWAGELADRTPAALRTFDENVFATGLNGQPVTPRIDVLDRLALRTYTWAAGPIREGADGNSLAPTYNPKPYPVIVLASVSIRFA